MYSKVAHNPARACKIYMVAFGCGVQAYFIIYTSMLMTDCSREGVSEKEFPGLRSGAMSRT